MARASAIARFGWLTRPGVGSRVEALDRFEEHINAAQRFADIAGLAQRLRFITGEADDILRDVNEVYDLVHEDGSFAAQPSYFDRMVELL